MPVFVPVYGSVFSQGVLNCVKPNRISHNRDGSTFRGARSAGSLSSTRSCSLEYRVPIRPAVRRLLDGKIAARMWPGSAARCRRSPDRVLSTALL